MSYELTITDRIWNRAAMAEGGREPRSGDRSLSAMLLIHSLIMNGGVEHAIECLSEVELEAGLQGYEFFNLDHLAAMIRKAGHEMSDTQLQQSDREYFETGDDSVLEGQFIKRFTEQPELFAPVTSEADETG